MSDVRVRRIRKGEWPVYRQARLEALRDAPEAFCATYETALERPEEAWQEQADAAAQGSDRAIFFALDGAAVVGMTAIYRDEESEERAELFQVWVAPGWRGKGLGRALMEAAADWATHAGCREALATVKYGNEAASRLYLKLGFSAEGQSPDGWLFRKRLGGAAGNA